MTPNKPYKQLGSLEVLLTSFSGRENRQIWDKLINRYAGLRGHDT